MSNAMRFGKRSLAAVAAGALALGTLTFAATSSANAADVTATVSPVRVTFTGTALNVVPYAKLSWTASSLRTNDTAVVTLTQAPSPAAQLAFALGTSAGATTGYVATNNPQFSGALAQATLGNAENGLAFSGTWATGQTASGSATTAAIAVAADTAGTYKGSLSIRSGTNGAVVNTVSFTITTTGAAASMTLTPTSQNVSVNGVATMLVTLKDAAGNATQPLVVDGVSMSVTPTGTGTPSPVTSTGGDVATSLYDGVAATTLQPTAAGTYSVTATPIGTLPAGGATAQNATVVASGNISQNGLRDIQVTGPADAINANVSNSSNNTAIIPSGTSSVTVTILGNASDTPGTVVRLRGIASAGTPSALAPQYVNVTLNASLVGTATFTLGAGAVAPTATFTVQQVNAANQDINAIDFRTIVTQTASEVTYATITTAPSGQAVAKVGAATSVAVTVENQFEAPQSGYAIAVYRGSVSSANFLGTANTNVSGEASLSVSPLTTTVAGQSETYIFVATAPGGAEPTGTRPQLVVNYTTTGEVSTMSVAIQNVIAGGGSVTTPITNATTSIPTIVNGLVPTDGVANTLASGNYTVATGVNPQAPAGEVVQFRILTNPQNSVTITTPTGVFVSSTAATAWNAGKSTLTIQGDNTANAYVFATKTGIHEVTFTSAGVTVKVPVRFSNAPADAYNVALTPATQSIEAGAFGTATLAVTDIFGNPVPGTLTGTPTVTGGVTISATGEVLLSGLASSINVGTDTTGKATITLIAGKAGAGTITAAPQGGVANLATAWNAAFVAPPTGAPAPVKSAAAAIVVTQDATRTLVITGERATVSGKPGIRFDGIADGFEDGAKVKPWIRFPGESAYNVGSARPVVTDEEFTWQRKTGKKVYVYFTSEDDAIKSNRVIIQAN